MNTELRKNAKNEFEKGFFKLMNNSVFGKTMENVRNHRDIKLITSDKRRKRLVSERNYHSHKKFPEHLMAIEMKKTRVKMIKSLYLGRSLLDISKTPGLFKDKSGGKIITEVVSLRAKTYAYLIHGYDDDYEKNKINKKAKGTKKCVIKQKVMFENYKDCLFNNKTIYRSQERFKSSCHDCNWTRTQNHLVLKQTLNHLAKMA